MGALQQTFQYIKDDEGNPSHFIPSSFFSLCWVVNSWETMAAACPLLAASLLLCSLLVIASANDYGVYVSSKTQAYDYGTAKPVNQQQLEKEGNPGYGSKPNVYESQPEEKGKPLLEATASIGYSTESVYQPQTEKPVTGMEEQPDYSTKPNKPQPEETGKSSYSTKPAYQLQPEKPESKQEEKPDYGTKPYYYKPQPGQEKEKPMPEETEKSGYSTKPVYQPQQGKPESKQEEKPDYGTKPNYYKPQPEDKEKPMPEETEKPGYSTKPAYQPQPEKPESKQEEKPDYGTKPYYYKPQPGQEKEKPMPEETEKPGYSTKPVYQPQQGKPESKKEEKPDYGTKPNYYKPRPEDMEKPMPEETEKPSYSTKPIYQPQTENEEKPDHGAKNDFYQQQPEDKENPKLENEEHPNYNANPATDSYKPKPEVLPIGVEGLVLCKSGPKYYPIRGALTRITCLTVDENGYEKTHSVCSGETDEKGYFLARLFSSGLDEAHLLSELRDCKAFLESSPLETCNVPVDVNKGISGAPLSGFRVLHHMGMKLFSVGSFFFTPQLTPVPNGY
ncbi:adhesive plaque matrix protein-like [Hibiscus syriacus]|uniref:adhesive plaque matrix protein-like n=1 Tax=Hibiscus syriacus TaxID=106335 RepID=UPI0019233550|nr:adhesive plaque matrix protein-like [Hibiscus syriacus]